MLLQREAQTLDHRLPEPNGVRKPNEISLGCRQPNRVQAKDRLRAVECPEDIRWAILGHEERTVAAGYGEGFSLPVLRKWIDKIGF